jgi:enoyl reductase-like protein
MTREEIIRMAQEAQMPFYWRTGEITYLDKLERFAALVASAEREACAKVCDDHCGWTPRMIGSTIRARGQA